MAGRPLLDLSTALDWLGSSFKHAHQPHQNTALKVWSDQFMSFSFSFLSFFPQCWAFVLLWTLLDLLLPLALLCSELLLGMGGASGGPP